MREGGGREGGGREGGREEVGVGMRKGGRNGRVRGEWRQRKEVRDKRDIERDLKGETS